jgi:phage FluMu gp28-like protein
MLKCPLPLVPYKNNDKQKPGRKTPQTDYELPDISLFKNSNLIKKREQQIQKKVDRAQNTVQLFKPHSGQADILKFIVNDKKVKFISLVCGRRFGKSLLCSNLCLYFALQRPKSEIMYVTPSYKLSKYIFEIVCSAISEKFPYLKKNGINKSDLKISFTNDSSIEFVSGNDIIAQNLRGRNCNRLAIIDEAALISTETWEKILRPIFLLTEKVISVGTPISKESWFYQMYSEGLSGNARYKSFHKPTMSNPLIQEEEIEDMRRLLPEHIFRQEVLAEFLEVDEASVFRGFRECIVPKSETSMTGKYYAGVDLGRSVDFSCLSILNDKHELVYINRWNGVSYSIILQNVSNVLNAFKPVDTWVETNSIGDIFFENLKERYNGKVSSFYTLNANKQEIVEQLIVDFERKNIKIFDYEPLIQELGNFGIEFSRSKRSIVYRAKLSGHDDTVMATCFANACFNKYAKHGKLNYYLSKKK